MAETHANSPQPFIAVDHVDVSAHGQLILQDISWRIASGENWIVVGGNGAGKSTLFKLLRGEIWPVPDSRGTVRYNINGKGLTRNRAGVTESIAYLSSEKQDAYQRNNWSMSGTHAILSGLTDNIWFQGEPDAQELASAKRIIDRLDLHNLAEKNTLVMTPGELRKVLLARALVSSPRCLILDEFCNGLDSSSRASLLQLINTIATLGTQVIYSTHRVEEIIPSLTHALLLKNGRILGLGKKDELLTSSELNNNLSAPARTTTETKTATVTSAECVIRLTNTSVSRNGSLILRDISWEMRGDQNWAILGDNGAGKSTFLRLVLGDILPVLGGTVSRFESDPPTTLWDIRRRIGYISSEFQTDYAPFATGREIVLSGFFGSVGLHVEPTTVQQEQAQQIILQFGLNDLSHRRLDALSYGESRRFLIARALVHQPELLVLDEAFNGLDIPSRQELLTLIETLVKTSSLRIIMATHHPEELLSVISHVLLLQGGASERCGPREQVLPAPLA